MHGQKHILIRMPNWIGDLVMATPILTDLRNAFRGAFLTAMCAAPTGKLLQEDPAIDELFCFKKPENRFLRRQEHRNIAAKIAAGKFDVGILLTNSFSSAWLFWQGRVKRRIGYIGHWRRLLLTNPILPAKGPLHQVDTYKKLLEPLEISRSLTAPRLYLLEKEIKESKQLLYQRGYTEGKPLIGIHPGAAYGSAKCWPPDRFRTLAKELLQDPEIFLVFFGDLATYPLIREICQGLPLRAMNLAGVTRLRELACLIKDVDVFLTNDTGPMHIGAALGTPLVALFGSTDEKITGPYGQKESVIHKHVHCSPCFHRVCPIDLRCMTAISVQEVLEKIQWALKTRKAMGKRV